MSEGHKVVIHCKFKLGDIVYMAVRANREKGMVTAITLRPDNCIMYGVTFDGGESTCYEIELTDTFVPDFQNQTED